MDFLTIVMIAAFAAVLVSLSGGILAMINGGEIGHKNETQWMVFRVAGQAAAVILLLLVMLAKNY